MTVAIPWPGLRRAVRRSSSSGTPKCMKRPPLQVPTAVTPSSGTARPDVFTPGSQDMPDDTRVTRASRGLLGLLFALAVAAAVPSTAAAERVLLAGQPGLSAAQRAEVRQEAGVRRTAAASFADGEVVSVPDARSGEALRALNASPDVRFAMPDVTFHLVTDDVYWTNQWALNAPNDVDINAPEAWTLSTGAGVTVAVIDTGVDAGHPDLAGHVRSDGYAYVAGAPTADAVGHGTHVAGIIAAVRNNGRGVAGAAPDATILPLKAFGSDDADAEDVVSAFDRAGRAGMRV